MSDNGDQDDGPVDRHISLEEQLQVARERIQALENVEETLTTQLHAQHHDLNQLQEELENAQEEVDQLREELEQVQQPSRRPTERTWYSKLHAGRDWHVVFKYAQGEENMSTRIDVRHPDVTFVDRTNPVLDIAEYQGVNEEPVSDGESLMNEYVLNNDNSPPRDSMSLDPEIEMVDGPDFNELPANCLGRILEFVLFKKYELETHSGMINAFHWGSRECSITDAFRPNGVLSVLLVCRRWYFLGLHAFYGLNTFAFSSLGEFGRFCTGIRAHRLQRIQHIELLWHGNYFLVNKRRMEKRGRGQLEVWRSKRTEKLDRLAEMRRLKTMVVFIEETRIRRKYEPNCVIDCHERETRGHPNYRPLRNLRTLSGLDNVLELRGMSYVRFYDTNAGEQSGGQRVPIWDWSFQEHVTRSVTQPKLPNRQARAELTKLTPLFPIGGANHNDDDHDDDDDHLYTPTNDDMEVVLRWYSGTQGSSQGNIEPNDRDDEAPSDDTHSVSIPDSEDDMSLSEPDPDNAMNLDDTESDDDLGDIGGISDDASQHSSSDGDSSGDDSDDSRFHGIRQRKLKDLSNIQFGESGSFVFKRESSTSSTFNFDLENVRDRSLSPFMNISPAVSPLSLFRAESVSMFVTPEPESGGVIDLTEDENESVATETKSLFSVSSGGGENGSVSTEAKRLFSVSSEEDGCDGDEHSGRNKRFRTDSVIHSSQEEIDAERFTSEPWN